MKQKTRKNPEEPIRTKKKIADEILRQIGGSVIFVLLLIAAASIVMVGWLSITAKKTELTIESNAAANQLNGFLQQYIRTAKQLAVNPEIRSVLQETTGDVEMRNAQKIDTVLENLTEITDTDSENVMATWISDLDTSALIQSDGFVSEEGWDITGRGWYGCIETKQPILTEPYIDSSTEKLILSAAAPVIDDVTGEVLGAAGMDIALDHMTQLMSEYKIGKQGYVLLLSENGTYLYHPQNELIQKNVADSDISQNVINTLHSKDDLFLRYKADGVTKYGFLEHVEDTGYVVLSSMPLSEFYAVLLFMVVALIVLFAAGIVLVAFRIRKSAARLTKPILDLNQTAQQLADGNLDVELNITSENEIGELGASFEKTVARLKKYIEYIDETAEVLAQLAEGKLSIRLHHDYEGEFQKIKNALFHISESMNQVMAGIHESSEHVSIGATELATASQALAYGAQAQASSVEQLTTTTDAVTEQVENSRSKAESSAKATAQAAAMIGENQENMRSMMIAMHNIHETSQKVVGIIQTIEEIASQTNLLSLNASIEAARAGEAGKGFAVVADEIGKLALESSKAASTTKELIEISMQEINKGNTIAEGAVSSLKESVNAISQVNEMIQESAENAAVQAENMEQLRSGIQEISHGIQDNSAASEETSATSEELASQADRLNKMLQRFELSQ
ncbi:hypothetical protein C823_003293 [Eubacterium plexicaudatum ASF492]|uniref:Methyl-accepting chemotaxis protein n=1 Tax=Eubacterium plexicaudatum ASF492 TaxID=1235802 RepID=N2AIE2_9FIRM|nr:hypothetical protein C823_003293 [Eubacterium plexicaudatum ASF492]